MSYPDYPSREKERLIHDALVKELVASFSEPISDELAAFLSKVKRAQLEDAIKGPPRMKHSWRVVWFQNPDRGNVWEGRIEEYEREAEDWEVG